MRGEDFGVREGEKERERGEKDVERREEERS